MKNVNKDKVQEAIDSMLESVDPKIAASIRAKFEEDTNAFSAAAIDADPSRGSFGTEYPNPAYWAKKSCNRCYGRGIIGKRLLSVGMLVPVSCSCGTNNYKKWLTEFRVFYTTLKNQQAREGTTNES